MAKPAQTTKSSGIWYLAKGRHDATMSDAAMDIHFMTFVTIDNLISPSSSVDGDPLFEFPDHWQPRFSTQFPLRRNQHRKRRTHGWHCASQMNMGFLVLGRFARHRRPRIRFLSIGSRVCSTLPSDPLHVVVLALCYYFTSIRP
jgi:hypothetical protein